jgi:hypothetical protein
VKPGFLKPQMDPTRSSSRFDKLKAPSQSSGLRRAGAKKLLILHEGREGTRRDSSMHPLYPKAHAWSGKVIGAVSVVNEFALRSLRPWCKKQAAFAFCATSL